VRSRSVGAYLGESTIADALTALQNRFNDVDLGSYPFNDEGRYGTTLVARGTDEARLDAVLEALRQLIIDHGAEPLARS
jgi:molybdopterin-biosynthesis enzyme MoeA-like protein